MVDNGEFLREIKMYPIDIQEKLLKLDKINRTKTYSKEEDLNISSLINDVMMELFNPLNLFDEPIIPFSFFETNIGRTILTAMSDIDNRLYTIPDLIYMTIDKDRPQGYSNQYISQEIKSGRLKAIKDGGRWLITHSEVQRFLKSKGIK